MKKAVCMVLAILMTAALFGCAKPEEGQAALSVETVPEKAMESETEMMTEAEAECTAEATEPEIMVQQTMLTTYSQPAPSEDVSDAWSDIPAVPTIESETDDSPQTAETAATEPDNLASFSVEAEDTVFSSTDAYALSDDVPADGAGSQRKISFWPSITAHKRHVWGPWVTVRKSTTTASGLAKRTCLICKACEYRTLDKLSHTHRYTVRYRKPATCTEEGSIVYACRCGDTYTRPIAKKAHRYTRIVVAATCAAQGYTEHFCIICKSSYTDTYTDALPHSFTDSVTAPTCTDKGFTTHTCKKCGYSCTDSETAAMGHSWTSWVTVKEATVASTGLMQRECGSCHQTETEIIDKIAHTHSYTPDHEYHASCTETYTVQYTCSCGDSNTDTIPAKGHTFGEWDTITAPTSDSTGLAMRSCTNCGLNETKVLDKLPPQHVHSYSVIESAESTCVNDGYVKKECACGDITTETIPAAGHKWEHHHEDGTGHYNVYIVCTCGYRFLAGNNYAADWYAHNESAHADDLWSNSYHSDSEWIQDTPAKDWDVCTVCGVTK